MHLSTLAATPLALALLVAPALAGPGEDMARSRIVAIAQGDVASITAAYGPKAALHWIGGPLDGTYVTRAALKTVWTKFATAQGDQRPAIVAVSEAANPKGSTVSADVIFAGKNTVKVRYVMVYRAGELVSEIWQVNPNASY